MKIKLNEEEKNLINQYFLNIIDLHSYERELLEKYPTMIELNENNTALEIINDYYIDEDKYELFKKSKEEYITNNYKELLLINDNLNCRYQLAINPKDTSDENAVKNGTLVLKVNKIIDYNKPLGIKLETIDKFEKELVRIENDINNKLGVPVRILSKKIILPIKKQN